MAVKKIIDEKIEISKADFEKLMAKVTELELKSDNKEEVKVVAKSDKKSPLMPGKIVIIEPIRGGATNFIPGDPDQATMLRGTGRSIMVPLDGKFNRLVDPLEPWEREYLEEVLKLNLDISSIDEDGVYNCFYTTQKSMIRFKKLGKNIESASKALDLGDPYQFLLYKIALSCPRVAKKWSERFNPNYEFVIKDQYAELAEDKVHSDKEDAVISYLLGIKSSKKPLFDLIRLYGNTNSLPAKVSIDSSVEWLYNELKKITKTVKGIRDLYNIISLNESNSSKLEMMILITDAVSSGIIINKGNKYMQQGGNIIGYSMDDAIDFLQKPVNRDLKMYITTEVEKYLKAKK